MKAKIKVMAAAIVLVASGIAFSSFSNKSTKEEAPMDLTNASEYVKVSAFVHEKICKPLQDNLGEKEGIFDDSFSRCASGYFASFEGEEPSVKTDRFVDGTIILDIGCDGQYVCDFKVNVKKGYAIVKDKKDNRFMSVTEFVNREKERR